MIYGDRIRLRPAEREDLPTFVSWLADPEIRKGISRYLPMSMAQEELWFEGMLKQPVDMQTLVIEVKRGSKKWITIGNCGFHNLNWRLRSAELGILIGEKKEWNKGYGTETMQLLLKHGFLALNLNRLELLVYEDNLGGVRAYEKAGFVHEGRLRQAQFSEGEYKDVLLMSVLRSEWKQQSDKP
jgi:RimJ/RimL family protein N-acetyltransferase